MKIVIIGSGNAAAVLGRKFVSAGHSVIQIFGRNISAAKELAKEWNSTAIPNIDKLNKEADVYLIAVSDDALPDIAKGLRLPGKAVAHTAASVSKEVLAPVTSHHAVFYPLQSLRKETKTIPEIPLFIEAATEEAKSMLQSLGESISPGHVSFISAEERMKLHIAAVIVNNFTNHLYTLAAEFCKKEKTDFRYLLPLIEETALRLRTVDPGTVQTGPAIRHDAETIIKHLAILENHPDLKKVYAFLSSSIGGKL